LQDSQGTQAYTLGAYATPLAPHPNMLPTSRYAELTLPQSVLRQAAIRSLTSNHKESSLGTTWQVSPSNLECPCYLELGGEARPTNTAKHADWPQSQHARSSSTRASRFSLVALKMSMISSCITGLRPCYKPAMPRSALTRLDTTLRYARYLS
jgi:hypothetical protein